MASSRHSTDVSRWVVIAGLLLCSAFVVLPLFELARQSLIGQNSQRFGLENYITFFSSSYFMRATYNSLAVATGTMLLALLIGVPLAYAFSRFAFPGKPVLRVLVLLSMMSPPFIGAYAWIILLGRGGIVTQWAHDLGVQTPTIYGPTGIIVASALSLYPIVFWIVAAAMRQLDHSVEEAASVLGRRPMGVFFSVTLPLLRPAVVTSAMLVFLAVLADFGLPNLLGEGERFQVLATLAYNLFLSEIGEEPGMAAVTSVVLVLMAGLVVGLGQWLNRSNRVFNDGSQRAVLKTPSKTQQGLLAGAAIGVVLLANAPIMVVLVSSFLEVRGAVFQHELTLGNYQKAFALMGNALTNSLVFAGTALVIVTVLGAVLGYVLTRQKTVLSRCLDFFLMVPFIVPGTVLGIGFVQVFNTPPVLLTGTASIIVIIYVIRRLPYVSRSSASMVHQIDISLEDASASLGARPMGTFTKIMLPLMRPGIFAGMVLAWLEIFNELSASIVLYTGATKTLPIAAYQQAVGGDFGLAAAYSGLLIAVTSVSIGLSMLFGDIDPARQNVPAAA